MKRLLIALGALPFLFLLPISAAGQNQTRPLMDAFLIKEVIPFGEQGFVAIFLDDLERPKRMRLQYFASDNAPGQVEVISLERQGIRAKFEGAFAWNGQLNILTSLYYPGPKRNHLMLHRYALPDLQSSEGYLVDEAYTPELYRVPFGFSLSPDSSRIMFYSWSYSLPKDPARVTVTVLNAFLDVVWQQRYVLPYKNESLYIYNCRITDDGRAFLLCENYTGKVGPTIDENKIEYFVLGGIDGDENMIIYDISPQGKSLRGLHIDPVPGNAMAGGAFYQDPGKSVHEGVYMFYIPPGGGKMEQGFLPISKDAYQKAYIYPGNDGFFNPNRRRFESYKIRKVDVLPDGSFLAAAEQEYYNESDVTYEFNDIMVMRVSPDLQRLSWMHRLPKRQSEGYNRSPFSPYSYKVFQQNGKWYFLFNDLAMNHAEVGGPRSIGRYLAADDNVVIVAEVDPSGKVRFFNLTRWLRSRQIIKAWISHSWNLGNKELLIFGAGRANSGDNFLIGIPWRELQEQPSRTVN